MSVEPKDADAVVKLYALDGLSLSFSDPAVERRFEEESLLASMFFIRTYIIGGILIYTAFSVLDVITEDSALAWMLFLRFGVVCPVLLGILITTFFPLFRRMSQRLLSLAMLSSGLSIVVMTAIMKSEYSLQYFVGIIVVVSYCGSLIRLRFVNSTLCAIFLFTSYQFVRLEIAPIPWRNFVADDFFLGSATLVGMLSSYIQELYFRRSYVAHKIVEAKNSLAARLLVESQKASVAKSDFLANMSHELRTPLNAVIGFSDIIRTQMYGSSGDPRYAEYAEDIYNSGTHLLAIINDILNLTKVEAGKYELSESRFELDEVVEDCIKRCSVQAAKRNIDVLFNVGGTPPILFGDRRLFLQIFLNLISNAIKFTPDEGRVSIGWQMEPQGAIAIQVSDTGVGIAAEDIERVVRPFEQVSTGYSRSTGGTGLGLPITKRFVELHGGSLVLESVVGAGTTVTIRLPPDRVVSAASPAERESEPVRPAATAYG
ncbi:MAG TPA: HAMP domain-containing sensor histidine kinase [Rhizomicrobium sp.]|nr:HAMP domain-containing sensor histidine kinase [Rhizomicrobium sp.]